LLKHSCGLATARVKQKLKGGPNTGRKELRTHALELYIHIVFAPNIDVRCSAEKNAEQ